MGTPSAQARLPRRPQRRRLAGPAHHHRRDHRRGRPTSAAVMAALELLRGHKVEFNVLAVVSANNVRRPLEVYRFLRECGVYGCANRLRFVSSPRPAPRTGPRAQWRCLRLRSLCLSGISPPQHHGAAHRRPGICSRAAGFRRKQAVEPARQLPYAPTCPLPPHVVAGASFCADVKSAADV